MTIIAYSTSEDGSEVIWNVDGTYTPVCSLCAWEGSGRSSETTALAAVHSHRGSHRHASVFVKDIHPGQLWRRIGTQPPVIVEVYQIHRADRLIRARRWDNIEGTVGKSLTIMFTDLSREWRKEER